MRSSNEAPNVKLSTVTTFPINYFLENLADRVPGRKNRKLTQVKTMTLISDKFYKLMIFYMSECMKKELA
jgi:hypothetical protein